MKESRYATRLRGVILKLYGVESKYLETVPVKETFNDQTVWEGAVEVFSLIDHPKATRCYAWAYTDDKGMEQTTAVLELPPVTSPQSAVQVAIASEIKNKRAI